MKQIIYIKNQSLKHKNRNIYNIIIDQFINQLIISNILKSNRNNLTYIFNYLTDKYTVNDTITYSIWFQKHIYSNHNIQHNNLHFQLRNIKHTYYNRFGSCTIFCNDCNRYIT